MKLFFLRTTGDGSGGLLPLLTLLGSAAKLFRFEDEADLLLDGALGGGISTLSGDGVAEPGRLPWYESCLLPGLLPVHMKTFVSIFRLKIFLA